MILNSQSALFVHFMHDWLSRSVRSSNKNCQSWICEPVLNSTCGEDVTAKGKNRIVNLVRYEISYFHHKKVIISRGWVILSCICK